MNNIKMIFSVLLAAGLLTIVTPNIVLASTATDENGFNQGYTSGLNQGGIDRHAKTFHIGTVCIGQTLAWCDGYIAGYLDGFFSTFPLSSTVVHHTTTIKTIVVHDNHHNHHDTGKMDKPKGNGTIT